MFKAIHGLAPHYLCNDVTMIVGVHGYNPGGGGALGQVSYGGVQLRGPNPYPILGKTGLRKHTLF